MLITQSCTPSTCLDLLYISLFLLSNIIQSYMALFSKYLKWTWSILLHHSFFHHHLHGIPKELLEFESSHTRFDPGCFEQVECVVCLSIIGEDEDMRELRCGHLFHRACLDQWLWLKNVTCPLCRDSLVLPTVVSQIGGDLFMSNYYLTSDYGEYRLWWI